MYSPVAIIWRNRYLKNHEPNTYLVIIINLQNEILLTRSSEKRNKLEHLCFFVYSDFLFCFFDSPVFLGHLVFSPLYISDIKSVFNTILKTKVSPEVGIKSQNSIETQYSCHEWKNYHFLMKKN